MFHFRIKYSVAQNAKLSSLRGHVGACFLGEIDRSKLALEQHVEKKRELLKTESDWLKFVFFVAQSFLADVDVHDIRVIFQTK